jgi:TBC1 domain family member 10
MSPRVPPPASPLSQFRFPKEKWQPPPSPTVKSPPPTQSTFVDTSPSKAATQIRSIASDAALAQSTKSRPSIENDRASVGSASNSILTSFQNGITRQTSLRSKLSLPNLRRVTSRQDEANSPIDPDLVQVKRMDFELIRPNFPQAGRSSEDSGVMGRDSSIDARTDAKFLRTDSPSMSLASPLSPTFGSDSSSSRGAFIPSVTNAPVGEPSPRPVESESTIEAYRHREQKWMAILSSVPASQSRKSKKIKKLLLEGVPASVQYLVWAHLTDGKSRIVPNVYSQLGARARVAAIGDIERDVNRSFMEHPHLKKSQGPVLSLLQAYLTMVPDIHYTTGKTF